MTARPVVTRIFWAFGLKSRLNELDKTIAAKIAVLINNLEGERIGISVIRAIKEISKIILCGSLKNSSSADL